MSIDSAIPRLGPGIGEGDVEPPELGEQRRHQRRPRGRVLDPLSME